MYDLGIKVTSTNLLCSLLCLGWKPL